MAERSQGLPTRLTYPQATKYDGLRHPLVFCETKPLLVELLPNELLSRLGAFFGTKPRAPDAADVPAGHKIRWPAPLRMVFAERSQVVKTKPALVELFPNELLSRLGALFAKRSQSLLKRPKYPQARKNDGLRHPSCIGCYEGRKGGWLDGAVGAVSGCRYGGRFLWLGRTTIPAGKMLYIRCLR